jgi:hypothetical protein
MGADPEIEMTTKNSTGGDIKTQISGERFKSIESYPVTGAQLRSILDLIKNGSNNYFYTPHTTPPEYDSTDFPMLCKIDYKGKTTRAVDGGAPIYYITLEITGVGYYS